MMNDHFDKELDFFSIGVIDAHTYISERLKNAVEANGLMGWVFTPTTKLDIGASGYLGEGRKPYESTSDIFRVAMTTSPVDYPVMFYVNGKDYIPYNQPNSGFNNPYVGATKRGFRTVTDSQIYSNLRLTQDLGFITKGLSLTGMFAFDTYNENIIKREKKEEVWEAQKYRDENGKLILKRVVNRSPMNQNKEVRGDKRYYLSLIHI